MTVTRKEIKKANDSMKNNDIKIKKWYTEEEINHACEKIDILKLKHHKRYLNYEKLL